LGLKSKKTRNQKIKISIGNKKLGKHSRAGVRVCRFSGVSWPVGVVALDILCYNKKVNRGLKQKL